MEEEIQKPKKTLVQFMNEEKLINRWLILRVGLMGMFLGALLYLAWSQVILYGFK